jgi:hypothetical protein
MKRAITLFFVLALCRELSAQVPQYIGASFDGTNVYAWATVDVSLQQNMVFCNQYGYCQPVVHTASVSGSLRNLTTGASTSGGTSAQNAATINLILPAFSDDLYEMDSQGQAFCTGCNCTFLATLFNLQFKVAFTKSQTDFNDPRTNQYASGDALDCIVNSWCTATTTPPACNPSYVFQFTAERSSCSSYYDTNWLAERNSSSSPWDCIPVIPIDNAIGTEDSSKLSCTTP